MIKFKILTALLFSVLFIFSCDVNDDKAQNNLNTEFSENLGSKVSRDFIGQIVDVNKAPLQNVTVTIGTKTVQTDVNGVFIINGAHVFQKFAHIKATKSGFIDGSRSMVPTSGKNNVRIMLISNTATQTIPSGSVSEVNLPNGTKVKFDGAFQDSFGRNYSGSVGVSTFHLMPSNENISSLMPGMLYAEDKNGDEKGLETFGMLHVELTGSGGQKLQIASGHTAEISVLIDDSQLATAPNTIPLWHFDEANGYWKEDGMATRQGNKYVGNVSHFSWWNCDTFNSVVTLTLTIVDSNGNPISNIGTKLTVNSTSFSSYLQYTNNNGEVSGLIPANESIILNVYDNCGGIVYTSTIGPFATDTTLPTITINNSILVSTIIGNLLKCDNSNVTNGYVILRNEDGAIFISTVNNGGFNFNTTYCSSSAHFNLEGFDSDNHQTTNLLTYNFAPNTTFVGNLSTCNSIPEYISYKIDNNPTVVLSENLYFSINYSNQLGIYGSDVNQKFIAINGVASGTGTNSLSSFHLSGTDLGDIYSGTSNTISYSASPIGPVGSYVDVTFNGTFTDSIATTHVLNGLIHVKRTN